MKRDIIRDIKVKSSTILQRLKRKYRRLTCKHERTAQFFPSEVMCNLPNGKRVRHNTVMITGCLNCHKVTIVDYGE